MSGYQVTRTFANDVPEFELASTSGGEPLLFPASTFEYALVERMEAVARHLEEIAYQLGGIRDQIAHNF